MSTFAQRLRQLRGERSQREMAMLLNVEQASYAYYELGKRQPKLDDFARMCRVLKVSADWMLGLPSENTPTPPAAKVAVLQALTSRLADDAANVKKLSHDL